MQVDDSRLKDRMQPEVIYPACLPDPEDSYYTSTLFAADWGVTVTKLIRVRAIGKAGLLLFFLDHMYGIAYNVSNFTYMLTLV